MPSVNFCFRIHQPYQFKSYCFSDIGKLHLYEDKAAMAVIMDGLAADCYLPANKILLEQIIKGKGKFRIAFSISGTTLELFEQFRPDLISSFRQLVNTGCVEILGETYYNSYAWLHSKEEFNRQVNAHEALVKKLFDCEPMVFRNTDLIHENELARHIAGMGHRGMLIDGSLNVLNGRSANQIYAAPDNGDFGLLPRNASLSEDIACYFGKGRGSRYALTAEKFAERLVHNHRDDSCSINLFLDYETFGIHKTGKRIFTFLEELPDAILSHKGYEFKTPVEILDDCYPKAIYDLPRPVAMDNNWQLCENIVQNEAMKKLHKLETLVHETADKKLLDTWGKLQSAEHFCFIAGSLPQDVHTYRFANKVNYTVEKYQQLVNILTDFEILLITACVEKNRKRFSQHLSKMLF
jgi:alpha-amylase